MKPEDFPIIEVSKMLDMAQSTTFINERPSIETEAIFELPEPLPQIGDCFRFQFKWGTAQTNSILLGVITNMSGSRAHVSAVFL